MSVREGKSIKWYVWSLVPLVVLTLASLADGYNYLVEYDGYDPSTITVEDMVRESPIGFLSGAVISGTMIAVIAIDDLFVFISRRFMKKPEE